MSHELFASESIAENVNQDQEAQLEANDQSIVNPHVRAALEAATMPGDNARQAADSIDSFLAYSSSVLISDE